MKDRGRNTRRQAYVAPAPKPWNRCPSCRGLVEIPVEGVGLGEAVDCSCGLELEVHIFNGALELLLVTVDIDALEREPHVCDHCANGKSVCGSPCPVHSGRSAR